VARCELGFADARRRPAGPGALRHVLCGVIA
jgi:hypothetical protein